MYIRLIQLILVIFFVFLFLPQTALAANCEFKYYSPSDLNTEITPNQNMGSDLFVKISSSGLKDGTFRVQLKRANSHSFDLQERDIKFTGGTGTTTINNSSRIGWIADRYTLYFIEQGKTGYPQDIYTCQTSFTITEEPVSSSCVASIENKPIDPDTEVVLVLDGIADGTYDIFVNDKRKFQKPITGGNARLVIDKFDVGIYTVTVEKDSRLQCNAVAFEVGNRGSGEGGQIDTGRRPAAKPCSDNDCTSGGGEPCAKDDPRGPGFKTAIGCVHTNPPELVKDFMTFAIGIGGGLAFLMMLLGAFQMLTSAGNPETLATGRSRITSAIIGLLFVIFAILLLKIIGVDILNIPGFKP